MTAFTSYTYRTICIAIIALVLTACGGGKAVKAKKAFDIGEYDRAERLYKQALLSTKDKNSSGALSFYLGECCRLKGHYKQAANAYSTALKNKYKDNRIYFYLGQCYLATGNLDKAEENFLLYKQVAATHAVEANAGLQSVKIARDNAEIMKNYNYKNPPDTGYIVTPARQFNSKSSDYCPMYVDDEFEVVYFTSMRSPKKRRKVNRITGQSNSTIYVSKVDGRGEWTEPEALDDPFGQKVDDGTPSISSDGKTMYFTRCPYTSDNENNAECYETVRTGGRWGEPVRVIPGGDSTMMVAHPAISPDGLTLYFVSDRDGGIGGKDIYMTTKNTDGTWSEAVNLGGLVNTRGDEMFPYVRRDGTLYFSSNGHEGYGGLDIYKAVLSETGRYVVSNMGFPINSSADDFGIVFKGNKEEGLFSSGRLKVGFDHIFSFVLPDVILTCEGKLTDVDGNVLERSYIKIVGSDGTNMKMRPSEDGTFGFRAEPNTTYLIQCGARGYVSQKLTVNTDGKTRSENIVLDVMLQKF